MKYLVVLFFLGMPLVTYANAESDEVYKSFIEMCAITASAIESLAVARDFGVPLRRQLEEIEKARKSNEKTSTNEILFNSMEDAAFAVFENPNVSPTEVYSLIFDHCVLRMNSIKMYLDKGDHE